MAFMKDIELTARCQGTFATPEPTYSVYSRKLDRTFSVQAFNQRAARITLCDYHIRVLGETDTHLSDLVVGERI